MDLQDHIAQDKTNDRAADAEGSHIGSCQILQQPAADQPDDAACQAQLPAKIGIGLFAVLDIL